MKVFELIELLKQQLQDADILLDIPEFDHISTKVEVYSFPPGNVVHIQADWTEDGFEA